MKQRNKIVISSTWAGWLQTTAVVVFTYPTRCSHGAGQGSCRDAVSHWHRSLHAVNTCEVPQQPVRHCTELPGADCCPRQQPSVCDSHGKSLVTSRLVENIFQVLSFTPGSDPGTVLSSENIFSGIVNKNLNVNPFYAVSD